MCEDCFDLNVVLNPRINLTLGPIPMYIRPKKIQPNEVFGLLKSEQTDNANLFEKIPLVLLENLFQI